MLGCWRILIGSHQLQSEGSSGCSCLKDVIILVVSSAFTSDLWKPWTRWWNKRNLAACDLRRYKLYVTCNKNWQNCITLKEQTQIWNDIDTYIIYIYIYYINNIQHIDTDLDVGMSQKQATLKITQQVSIFPGHKQIMWVIPIPLLKARPCRILGPSQGLTAEIAWSTNSSKDKPSFGAEIRGRWFRFHWMVWFTYYT